MTKFGLAFCGFLFCLRAMAAPADFNSGLAGQWRFEGCDGKIVKDLSPRGNDGLIEFGELRKEKGTMSLELDGLDGHVLIPETTPFDFSNAITTVVWVKAAEWNNRAVLFGIPHTNDAWTTPMFGMYVADNRVVFGMWGTRDTSKLLLETAADLPLDTWTMLTATCDGTTARLYVNKTLSAEKPHSGTLARNGQPLIIGEGLGNAKPCFRGRVGELRLYARGFTTDEVRALYGQMATDYDLTAPVKRTHKDGTVLVESHESRPDETKPWRPNPTRLIELLERYKPSGDSVKLDRYGGSLDAPREKATGFFYVKKNNDRYWLVDPNGCRFIHIAMNTVREPRNVDAKFGSAERWAEAVTAQLRANGFNGLGNGSAPRLQQVKSPLVWVRRKDFMFAFAREKKLTEAAAGTQGFTQRCMPVFHPDFEAFCENFGKDLADTADDPNLLGVMTDNELQCPVDLLDRYLSLDARDPNLKSGRDAAAAWLTARKGAGNSSTNTVTVRDRYEFIAFAFERYYRIVTRVIRKYDPHHLYLGSRINYHAGEFDNPYFWKALAPYHDVVSVNYYHYWGPQAEQFAAWEKWAGRPIILTEWYAKAMDVPGLANRLGAGWLVRTQEDRARYYQHFALNALEIKNIVGWHWFKYLDDPAESTALDSAGGANKGMFDLQGKPYLPLLERARAVNREAYPLIEFFDTRNRE